MRSLAQKLSDKNAHKQSLEATESGSPVFVFQMFVVNDRGQATTAAIVSIEANGWKLDTMSSYAANSAKADHMMMVFRPGTENLTNSDGKDAIGNSLRPRATPADSPAR
jgi:hypothetical protein